jgi:flagella basal body P-ring formation protein FlgA
MNVIGQPACSLNTSRWHAACSTFLTMKPQPQFNWILTLTLLCVTTRGHAQAAQPLTDVSAAASAFVSTQLHTDRGAPSAVHVTISALDPRLRLPLCSHSPEGFAPTPLRAAARMTVGVRCKQPAWTIYVPVSVETELRVLVLRKAALRHATLSAEDVDTQTQRVAGLADSYVTDVTQLQRRHLRIAAAQGTALTLDLLVADVLVKRGQRVTLVAAAGGLEVRADGEAIADATPAGRVRVLNLTSRKIVEGQAESSDRVRISL